jgi:HAD superfamily phosphoserine phosphatase-like hydrolase
LISNINSEPGLACFDFDNTVIFNDIGEALIERILNEGLLNFAPTAPEFFQKPDDALKAFKSSDKGKRYIWTEYRRIFNDEGMEKAYRWSSILFSGWSKKDFFQMTQEVWNHEKKSHTQLVREGVPYHKNDFAIPYPEMQDLMEYLKFHNWKVKIVSGSPTWAIQAIISDWNLEESDVLGMELELDPKGLSSSRIVEPYTFGMGKVQTVQNNLGELHHLAFGDSPNDIDLLNHAKKSAFVIDRGKEPFRTVCIKNGYRMQPRFFDLN